MVLPFVNDTGDDSLQWMELGLSDMLAQALASSGTLPVVRPASSHSMLAVNGLDWPPQQKQLQQLLSTTGAQMVLYSRVTRYRDQQVLNIQLYRADGRIEEGSISYPQLSVAISAVASRLLQLIEPRQSAPALSVAPASPASLQDMVRGLQALQQQGPELAENYFHAAALRDPTNLWAVAYAAKAGLLQGQWQKAEAMLSRLEPQQDRALAGFICRWLGELAYRRGALETARERLLNCASEAASRADIPVQYQSYRLLSQLAHQQQDWQAFRDWQARASSLPLAGAELAVQAERLFYLGDPVGVGLEQDPDTDLLADGARLRQALRYFQQLANQPRIAAVRFAIAQNFSLPLAEREAALKEAILLWRSLNMPFELAQALVYQGFFRLQLHQGDLAREPLEEAIALTSDLGAGWLNGQAWLYRHFADLDAGLQAEGAVRGAMLRQAVSGFEHLLQAGQLTAKEQADARVLSGWGLAALGLQGEASQRQQQAARFYLEAGMGVSLGYALYSQMWSALEENRLDVVLALADQPITTRLQLRYLAEAWHRKGQTERAAAMYERIRTLFADSWSSQDDDVLAQYWNNPEQGLGLLPAAWTVYCESDWQLAGSSGQRQGVGL